MLKKIVYFSGHKNDDIKEQSDGFDKFEILKKYFINKFELVRVNYNDYLTNKQVIERINLDRDIVGVVASSLGCLPALLTFFNSSIKRKLILINPSFNPELTLSKILSYDELKCLNDLKFEILYKLSTADNNKHLLKSILLMTANNDERIKPYQFNYFNNIFEPYIDYIDVVWQGGHRYECLSDKLSLIEIFITDNKKSIEDFFQLDDKINMENII